MATILPLAETQFNDALGVPLAGGKVYFYQPNTTTPKDTYQDSAQTITNSNPVTLDSAGRAIILGSGSYRQVVYDALGNLIWDQTTSESVVGQTSFGGTSTGSANAQVVSAGTFSGADGSVINFTAGFTNTGAMTIQVGPTGSPIAVLKNGPSGPVNLVAGDIVAGNIYSISYSVVGGTFQLLQSIPPILQIASQAEAQAGTNNTDVMTPLRTNQAIASLTSQNYKTPNIAVLTTGSGTYTTPTGALYLRSRMIAGGGGGAAQSTNAGSAGSNTSFGTWTAIHGNGGATNGGTGGTGGTGGVNGTGTVIRRLDGADGQSAPGNTLNSPTTTIIGGAGGNSPFGGAGAGVNNSAGRAAKANTGSGGAGGGAGGGGSPGAGGGAGEFVEFLITSPSATYSYTVGAGGGGGAAGGNAGGNGAAGRIEVEAYFQ